MIQIKRTGTINKPIDDVWEVLYGGFADVGKWVTGVYKSRPGTKEEKYDRVCTTFTGKLYEKILSTDKKNHTFEVDAKGLPFFVKKFTGGWRLQKVSANVTKATLGLKIQTKGIIGAIMQIPMKSKLNAGLNETMSDLATYVETGRVSISKQKRVKEKTLNSISYKIF